VVGVVREQHQGVLTAALQPYRGVERRPHPVGGDVDVSCADAGISQDGLGGNAVLNLADLHLHRLAAALGGEGDVHGRHVPATGEGEGLGEGVDGSTDRAGADDAANEKLAAAGELASAVGAASAGELDQLGAGRDVGRDGELPRQDAVAVC
jgi:hypothetical protein